MRALMAAVLIGGAFGSASAEVKSIEDEVMTVEMEVEVLVSAESVVAHLSFDTDRPLTLPLLDRGGGVFGITTELEPNNYMVVFEVLGANAERSEPVSLTWLGADLIPDSGSGAPPEEDDDSLSSESSRYLWLAVALGAASLSALAFWVLGGRDDEDAEDEDHRGDEAKMAEPGVESDEG
jgi:hypothetical protein